MKKRTKVSKLQINPRLITSKVENKFRTGRSSSSLLRSTDYPKDSKDGMVMQFKLPKRQYQNMKDP